MRENGIDWKDDGPAVSTSNEVQGLIWRWAKNIRRGSQTQYCPSLKEVTEFFGNPPVTKEEWTKMCAENEYPLESYTAAAVNEQLAKMFEDATIKPTSTSLRDLCHQVLKQKYSGNAQKMVVHTVHRSTKSLQAAYVANRPRIVVARKEKVAKAEKRRTPKKPTPQKTKPNCRKNRKH
jgi:hypothetical protein